MEYSFNISEKEIEGWIDTWAKRLTEVKRAKAKHNDDRAQEFAHLLNGHRFCYVQEIAKHVPRYSLYQIPSPENKHELIDIKITVYYESQVVNCRKCLSEEHETKECQKPKKVYNPELEIFRGHRNPLSNLYETQLKVDNHEYPSL